MITENALLGCESDTGEQDLQKQDIIFSSVGWGVMHLV